MEPSFFDNTFTLLAVAGVSLTVAGLTWYVGLRFAYGLRRQSRLDERKRKLYLEMYKLVLKPLTEAKKKSGLSAEQIARQFFTSEPFRLAQMELLMIAPDDVVQTLSWHVIPVGVEPDRGGQYSMYNIGLMMRAIREDMVGKTRLSPTDLWQLFIVDDLKANPELLWDQQMVDDMARRR